MSENPEELEILGDGNQTKSYLEVHECIAAMLYATGKARGTVNTFNVGSEDWIDVKSIAEIVTEEMRLPGTKFRFTGETVAGWAMSRRCSSPWRRSRGSGGNRRSAHGKVSGSQSGNC